MILNLLGAGLTLLGGVALLALTWAFTYLVSLVTLGQWLGYHHWMHGVAGCLLVPLLFWGNARTSREYLSDYSVTVGTVCDKVQTFFLPGVGMASNVNPLAPDTMHTGVKMVTDCLYAGPRMVGSGLRLLRKTSRLWGLDLAGCGAAIAVLVAAPGKVPFQEIVNHVPSLNPVRVFPQLQEIEGVLFLQAEPAGLALSEELREEIRHRA